ncbi:MAG: FGGY-family carbohydrate kinase [Pseudomonadota bacterium]
MPNTGDTIIGIDAGTSVIKAVAFSLSGNEIAVSAVRNSYATRADGSATQSMDQTWADCCAALRGLSAKVDRLAERVAAIGVTGQGDGTWLVGAEQRPVTDAWLWLDARAGPTVNALTQSAADAGRFAATGTGLNTCQQGTQMAHMAVHFPDFLDQAQAVLHCKDWLYLKLTGIVATDPSEASFTFGDFRSRAYSDTVVEALGLRRYTHLLPDILDGTEATHPLNEAAATATGLLPGTPVSLGYVDMVMTALGAGVHTGKTGAACSIIGSTGVHLRSVRAEDVHLNEDRTGYVICLPMPGLVTQVQTNMAATLNVDWALDLAADLLGQFGTAPDRAALVGQIDTWLQTSPPGRVVFHPYISDAGERGPFVDDRARASVIGLNTSHRFADLIRGVFDGLGMAARDCYHAMGGLPAELRIAGGAAQSPLVRQVFAGALASPVRVSTRGEAGAAGCAMMAAVAIGAYPDMEACIKEWVEPFLGPSEPPEPHLRVTYDALYQTYRLSRDLLPPVWAEMATNRAAFEVLT